jgi:acyl carrier protein phosphodiesterase
MNFLAHLYLAGDNEEVIFGNFIADGVKGNPKNGYSEGIRDGIKLHREIDRYTDNHSVVKQSKTRLSPKYRKFSGVIVDLYYDHFLSKNWADYSDKDLYRFVSTAYDLLIRKYNLLPPHPKRILPYMVTFNWLVGYADLGILQRVFKGMSHRTKFDSGMENAVSDLEENYTLFEKEFREFFPEIIGHISKFRIENSIGT